MQIRRLVGPLAALATVCVACKAHVLSESVVKGDDVQGKGGVDVLTHHNNAGRTGVNAEETTLKPANVGPGSFGRLFSRQVDGQIYAQPLVVSGLDIGGQTRNVVYVATAHNDVYAFDADDPKAAKPLWHVNLGAPVVYPITYLNPGNEYANCRDITPEVGIIATPVIDRAANVMYVTKKTRNNAGQQVWALHALDIRTGQDAQPAQLMTVQGPGAAAFEAAHELQRAALLLNNGILYIAFAGHCDAGVYAGWILAYRAADLTQVATWTPGGREGGIWMAGNGPAADADGNVYVSTGNGPAGERPFGNDHQLPTPINFNNALIKLTLANNALTVADWFIPRDVDLHNDKDLDLGSSGVVLLPGTRLGLGGGKPGIIHVFNLDAFGHFDKARNANLQSFGADPAITADRIQARSYPVGFGNEADPAHNLHGGPVFWNNTLFLGTELDRERAFRFDPATQRFDPTPASSVPTALPIGMPGAFQSLSANGTDGGVLWVSHPLGDGNKKAAVPGILRAYDATDLTKELWNSEMDARRDAVGYYPKFNVPTIANGKVYAPSFSGALHVYGLLPQGAQGFLYGNHYRAGTVSLTDDGATDWVHFGLEAPDSVTRKAGVGEADRIGSLNLIGGGALQRFADSRVRVAFTDGSDNAAGGTTTGVFAAGLHNGFELTAPADTNERTLRVYVGAFSAHGRFEATLSDGSAPSYLDTSVAPRAAGAENVVYAVTYRASEAGQTLTVRYTYLPSWQFGTRFGTTGNVTLQAASLVVDNLDLYGKDASGQADEAIRRCVSRNGGPSVVGTPAAADGTVHAWTASGQTATIQSYEGGKIGPCLCVKGAAGTEAYMVRGTIRDVFLARNLATGVPLADEHAQPPVLFRTSYYLLPAQPFENQYITVKNGETTPQAFDNPMDLNRAFNPNGNDQQWN